MRIRSFCALGIVLLSGAATAQITPRVGQWEIRTVTRTSDGAAGSKAREESEVERQCMTAADVKDFLTDLMGEKSKNPECQWSEKRGSNSLSVQGVCPDKSGMSFELTTESAERFSGNGVIRFPQKGGAVTEIRTTVTAKWQAAKCESK